MSNKFYNYLSDKIKYFFKNSEIRLGDKFFIQFDEEYRVDESGKEEYIIKKEDVVTSDNQEVLYDDKGDIVAVVDKDDKLDESDKGYDDAKTFKDEKGNDVRVDEDDALQLGELTDANGNGIKKFVGVKENQIGDSKQAGWNSNDDIFMIIDGNKVAVDVDGSIFSSGFDPNLKVKVTSPNINNNEEMEISIKDWNNNTKPENTKTVMYNGHVIYVDKDALDIKNEQYEIDLGDGKTAKVNIDYDTEIDYDTNGVPHERKTEKITYEVDGKTYTYDGLATGFWGGTKTDFELTNKDDKNDYINFTLTGNDITAEHVLVGSRWGFGWRGDRVSVSNLSYHASADGSGHQTVYNDFIGEYDGSKNSDGTFNLKNITDSSEDAKHDSTSVTTSWDKYGRQTNLDRAEYTWKGDYDDVGRAKEIEYIAPYTTEDGEERGSFKETYAYSSDDPDAAAICTSRVEYSGTLKDIKYDKSDIKEAVPENYKETTITYNGVDENGERIEVSRQTEVKTAYTEEDKKQVREYLEGLQKEDPSITDEEIEEIVNKDSTMTFQYIDGVRYDKEVSNIKVDVYGSVYGEEEQFFRTEYINSKKQNTISTTTVDDESTKSYKTVKTTLSEQDVITAYNNTGDENVDSVVRSKLETPQENSTLYDDKNRVVYETQKGGVFKTTVIDGGNTERKTGDVLSYGKTDKATSYTYYDDPEDENYGEVETNTVSKEYDYLDRSNQYGEAAKNGIVTVSVTNTKGKFLLETTTESKTYVLGEGTKDKDGKENISTRSANFDIDPVEHTYTYSQSISLGGGLLIDVGEGNSISKETRERILQYIDDLDDEKLKAATLDMTDEQLARLVTSDTYTIFGVSVDFKEGSVSVEENVSTKTIYDAGGNVVSSIKDGGETGGTYTYDLSAKGKEQFGTGVDFSTLSDVNFSASGIFTGKSTIDTAGSSVAGQGKSINDTIISDMKGGTDNVLGDKISFSQYRQDYGYEKDDLGRVTSSKFVENVNGGWIAGETTSTYTTENNSTVATSVTSYASVVTDENGNIPRNADGSIKLDSIVTDESTRETKEPQTGLYTYSNVGHNAPIDVSMKGIDQYNALGDIRDAQRMTKDATTNAIWTGAVTALYVAASVALAIVTFGASAVIQLTATSAIMAIMAIAAIPAVYNGMKRGMNAVSVGDTKTAVMEFAFVALDFAVVVGGFMKIATALAESGKELSGILGVAQKIGAKAASVSQAIAESRAGKILKFLSPKTTLSQQAKLISEGAKTSKVFGFLSNSKVLNFVAGLGGTSWGKALDLVGSIARNALIFGINMDIKIPISGKTILPIHHEGLLGLVLNKIGAEELANNEVFQAATTLLTFAPIFNEEFARAKDGAAGTDKTFMESIKGDKTLGELYRESINAFKMNTLGGATTIPGAMLNFVTNAFAGSAGMIADITKFNFIVSNGVFGGIKTLVYNTTGVELGETGNGLLDFLFKGSKVYSSAADFMEYSLTSSASMMTNSSMWAFSFMTPVFTTALTPLLQKIPVIGETIRAFNYASESASNQYVSTFLEENVKEELLGHIWDWVPSDEMKEILQECFDDTPDINVNIQNLNTNIGNNIYLFFLEDSYQR